MHALTGAREASGARSTVAVDDQRERGLARRAVTVSALVLFITGMTELSLALFSGSVGLFGDALHNLSDVSTSLAVFVGFQASKNPRPSVSPMASTGLKISPGSRSPRQSGPVPSLRVWRACTNSSTRRVPTTPPGLRSVR